MGVQVGGTTGLLGDPELPGRVELESAGLLSTL